MGIYIKGMEMPKEAGKYRIEFDQCGNPYLLSDNGDGGIWHIIPVPPHGDLIDRDKFRKTMFIGEQCLYSWDEIEDAIDFAPAVIPEDQPKEEA